MKWTHDRRRLDRRAKAAVLCLVMTAWATGPALAAQAPDAAVAARDTARDIPAGVIEMDETVISGNQELPKVLYIVPWQQPDGLPDIELRTDFAEVDLFRRLYPPAYRRELSYHEASDTARGTHDVASAAGTQASDSKE